MGELVAFAAGILVGWYLFQIFHFNKRVRRGHWISCKSYNQDFKGFKCSECGAQFQGYRPDNYCGNCGAKME